ncbi:MAG: hypothetical protein CMP47_12890 [Rickettsiales bacterium]|nr:hypothetical protein [Rickettsiales bacterium]
MEARRNGNQGGKFGRGNNPAGANVGGQTPAVSLAQVFEEHPGQAGQGYGYDQDDLATISSRYGSCVWLPQRLEIAMPACT